MTEKCEHFFELLKMEPLHPGPRAPELEGTVALRCAHCLRIETMDEKDVTFLGMGTCGICTRDYPLLGVRGGSCADSARCPTCVAKESKKK